MGSRFEKLSDDQLNKYMTYFNKITQDIEYSDLDEFYQNIAYDEKLSTKIGAPVGIKELLRLDIEYLYHFIETGQRPQLTSMEVNFITDERVRTLYTRTEYLETYAEDSINSDYLRSLNSSGEIEPWDWEITDEDHRDSDVVDDWFDV